MPARTRALAVAGTAAVALAAFLVYWETRTAQPTADSLTYAWAAKSRASLFHPHHLLSSVPALGIQAVGRVLGWRGDELAAGQLHSCLWAIFGLFGMRRLGMRAGLGAQRAGLAAAALAASFGYWSFATQMESIVPATASATWCLASAAAGPGAGRWRGAATGAWWVVATLFHQTSLLLFFPLSYLWVAGEGRVGLRRSVRVTAWVGLTLAGAYLLAFQVVGADFGNSLRAFLLAYLLHPDPEWGTWSHFRLPGLVAALRSQAEALLAAGPLGSSGSLLAGSGLFFCLLWRSARLQWRSNPLLGACVVWAGSLWLFFIWWLPMAAKFFVQPLVPVLVLLVHAASDPVGRVRPAGIAGGRRLVALAIVPLVLGGWNLEHGVLPAHRQPTAERRAAEAIAELAGADCGGVAGYEAWVHLRLLLPEDRARIDPRFWIFLGTARPRFADRSATPCQVIPLEIVDPVVKVAGRSGVDAPVAWWAWAREVAQVERDPGTGGCRMAELQVRTGTDGRPYLRVGPETQPVGSGRELLERLAALTGSPAPSAESSGWVSVLEEQLVTPACAEQAPEAAK